MDPPRDILILSVLLHSLVNLRWDDLTSLHIVDNIIDEVVEELLVACFCEDSEGFAPNKFVDELFKVYANMRDTGTDE